MATVRRHRRTTASWTQRYRHDRPFERDEVCGEGETKKERFALAAQWRATASCNALSLAYTLLTWRALKGMKQEAPRKDSLNRLFSFEKLERAKGFEPSTPTLARLCSTPELHPLNPHRSGVVDGPWAATLRRRALYGPIDFQMQQGNDGKAKKNSKCPEAASQTAANSRKSVDHEHCKTCSSDLIRAPYPFHSRRMPR